MKKLFFTTLLSACALIVFGQTPALKVAQDGNVGINNSTPTEKLEVTGNIVIPNSSFYLSLRNGGGKQQVFGMDSNNDITFNRSAITSNSTSGLIFGATNNKFIDFRNQDNTVLMRIQPSNNRVGIATNAPSQILTLGAGNAAKPGGGDWVATSDRRAKKDIKKFDKGLEEVLKIKPVYFKYNGKFGTQDDGREFVGVIAQEIQVNRSIYCGDKHFQRYRNHLFFGKRNPRNG